jgi:hypothetical protein
MAKTKRVSIQAMLPERSSHVVASRTAHLPAPKGVSADSTATPSAVRNPSPRAGRLDSLYRRDSVDAAVDSINLVDLERAEEQRSVDDDNRGNTDRGADDLCDSRSPSAEKALSARPLGIGHVRISEAEGDCVGERAARCAAIDVSEE